MVDIQEKLEVSMDKLRKLADLKFALTTVVMFWFSLTVLSILRYSAWLEILYKNGKLGTLTLDSIYRMYPFAGCSYHIPEVNLFAMTVVSLGVGVAAGKFMSTDSISSSASRKLQIVTVLGTVGFVIASIGQVYTDASLHLQKEIASNLGSFVTVLPISPTVFLGVGSGLVLVSVYIVVSVLDD